jgi:hypothetical protein
MCVQAGWFPSRRELLRVPQEEPRRVGAPSREDQTQRDEQKAIAGQGAARPDSRIRQKDERGNQGHGITKNGAMIQAARRTPNRIGSVMQP